MNETTKAGWRRAALILFLAALMLGGSLAAYKPSQVAMDEMSPAGASRIGWFNGYAGMDTTIDLPFLATDWYIQTSAACSVAVSQSDALASFTANFGSGDPRKVVRAAVDTFLAGHPNAGESRIDTLYMPLGASEQYSLDLKISRLKVKVATGTPTVRYQTTGNRAF